MTKHDIKLIVSDDGKIFRSTDMHEYVHHIDKAGYHSIVVKRYHRYLVHRLVAKAFLVDYDELKDVHHIDENKSNNNLSNLKCIDKGLHQKLHKTKYSKIKRCVVCGKEFEPPPTKRNRNKVCSNECRLLYLKSHNAQYKIPIEQLSIDGEVIKEWNSARDVQNELGFFESNINKCCNGHINTYKGFKWRYAKK